MRLNEFGLVHRLRVRWAEADIQGVVFNANYMLYLDVAITEYLREMAQGESSWLREIFDRMYVKKSTLEFFAPARFDELLDVGVRTERIGNSSMVVGFGIFRGEELLLSAQTIYVYAIDGKPRPIPSHYRERAATLDPVIFRTGSWEAMREAAAPIRHEVFVTEQGFAAEIEIDDQDPLSLHCVATLCGQAIGTGRLLPQGKIGRMAVLPKYRQRLVGAGVLASLIKKASEQGFKQVELAAQLHAVPFYARHGFVASGAHHEEEGVAHQTMVRQL
jgi:YbgC/YbaW family acyl-CoA thioester hydrolase